MQRPSSSSYSEKESKKDIFIKFFPTVPRDSCRRGGAKSVRARGMRTPRQWCPLNQLSQVLKNSQSLQQQAQGVHESAYQVICSIYQSFHFSIFIEFLNMWMSGSPALESVLGALLFLLELSCPVFMIVFVLNYYILSYWVVISQKRVLF